MGNELIALTLEKDIRSVAGLPALEEQWIARQPRDTPKSQLVDNIHRFWRNEMQKRPDSLEPKVKAYKDILSEPQWAAGKKPTLVSYLLDTGLVRYVDRGRTQKLEVKAPLLARIFDAAWVDEIVI